MTPDADAVYALLDELDRRYPDPMTPQTGARLSSTACRSNFRKLLTRSEAPMLFRSWGYQEGYILAGWPVDETINLLSFILE